MDAATLVQQAVTSHPVVIFSKTYCPFCHSAKADIASASKSVSDLPSPTIFELDRMGTLGAQVQAELASRTGRRTVPNVFIGGTSVGGGDEVNSMSRSGILKQVVAQAGTKLKSQATNKTDDVMNIDKMIETNAVMVYSKVYCPFCTKAKDVLERIGQGVDGYVAAKVLELDEMGEKGVQLQQKLMQKTGQRTVPNIWIGQKHIGGCDDLLALGDQLPAILKQAYSSVPKVNGDSTKQKNNVKEIVFGAG